jgi:hypothetical protein
VRRVSRIGRRGPVATIAEGAGRHYPRMALNGDELLFSWVEDTRGTTRVRTARSIVK